MTTNERLERIAELCQARGGDAWWNDEYNDCEITTPQFDLTFTCSVKNLDAIEALLAATDAGGPVVAIELDCYDCDLDPLRCGMSRGVSAETGEGPHVPGPKCLGEGPHRLVPVDGGV